MSRYQNVSLRITGLTLFPFSRAVMENGTVRFSGLSGYVLGLLQQSMGFKYVGCPYLDAWM
ncbi:hypothetical protein IscW_ISCW005351 [Ixodes scapularis]|uniref:Uncharacterized protein n=1 Tax=Ixodes scapularis TaxID=6945 RepID=B7PNW9_IXOSC|nr:hypothetical protein IscW_ISCW005351 [Ixodes scapularis]|eukprot:XP_002435461.1 hypothetical protein IscW_ISCW005351 [Ixodes scapularis]